MGVLGDDDLIDTGMTEATKIPQPDFNAVGGPFLTTGPFVHKANDLSHCVLKFAPDVVKQFCGVSPPHPPRSRRNSLRGL